MKQTSKQATSFVQLFSSLHHDIGVAVLEPTQNIKWCVDRKETLTTAKEATFRRGGPENLTSL